MNIRSSLNVQLYLFFTIGIAFPAAAQEIEIHGNVVMESRQPMEGVHVWLYNLPDTTNLMTTATDANGIFRFPNGRKGAYRLEISSVGYTKRITTVHVTNTSTADLGTTVLKETAVKMGDVMVIERMPPAVQNGDTTEFNAKAFKTHPDATLEELVIKMPGITVDNTGTVQAGGETVQRVLIDGKPFFGDDPTLAIRNLPAEVVDKIQVFDQMSDQAQFTGFDDGQYTKTMNIVTRRRNKVNDFGKVTGGYGDDYRYNAAANLNYFDGDSRMSLLGSSNNTNTQNFSTQDLLGVLSSGSQQRSFGRGGGGGQRQGNQQRGFTPGGSSSSSSTLIGQQQGINTTSMAGGNYSDTVAPHMFLQTNYFFNHINNENNQSLDRQYSYSQDSTSLYDQQSSSKNQNGNHRFNARFDYALDASNSMMVTPQLLFQTNDKTSMTNAVSSLPSGVLLSESMTGSHSSTSGNNLSGHILFRHKYEIPGRTLSLDINISEAQKTSDGSLHAFNTYTGTLVDSTGTLNEQSHGTSCSISVTPTLVYTEPLGVFSQLEVNYAPSYSKGTADKRTYDFDSTLQQYALFNQSLSNTYETRYLTQHTGIAYRFNNRVVNMNIGVAYQRANLENTQTFPESSSITRSFTSILPSAMVNWRFDEKENLRLYYQTATRAPSVTQLQNVVDNSNPLLLTAGNPDLKQSYTHTLLSRLTQANPEAGKNFIVLLSASYAQDYIGTATIVPIKDTVVMGTHVASGSQLSLPENFNGYWSLRSYMTYGFPFDWISSNMNLNTGLNYTQTPGSVNSALNIARTYTMTAGAVVGSNISPNLDFTLTYTGNYNLSRNTLQTSLNTNYYSHTAGLRFNWIFWDGVVFHDEVMNALNNGQGSGYNQNSVLWNMSLAQKFFAKQSGEVRLTVNDLLAQNKSLIRTITSSYVEDARNEVLTRYVMLAFTYTMR